MKKLSKCIHQPVTKKKQLMIINKKNVPMVLVTRHTLLLVFANQSKKTVAARAKTDALDLRVLKATSSAMYSKDRPRFLAMTWVKGNIIEGFCPLSYGEKPSVRATLRLTASSDFPITRLHNQSVKHMVIEMYAATTALFKKEMAVEVGGIALLHLNLDLWVDKFSSLKYMGKQERICGIAPPPFRLV